MMTIKEMTSVMQAAERGEQIQIRLYDNARDTWKDTSTPLWDWAKYEYRVKPGIKFRAFQTVSEIFEAIKEHGDWIVEDNSCYIKILEINIYGIETHDRSIPFNKLFEEGFTFADGTPCGKLEDNQDE